MLLFTNKSPFPFCHSLSHRSRKVSYSIILLATYVRSYLGLYLLQNGSQDVHYRLYKAFCLESPLKERTQPQHSSRKSMLRWKNAFQEQISFQWSKIMTSPWITSSRSNGPHTAAHRLPITSVNVKNHGNSRNAEDALRRRISFSKSEDSGVGHASRHSAAFGSNEYHGPTVIRSWSPPYSEGNDVGAVARDNRDQLGQDNLEAGSPRVGNNPLPSSGDPKPSSGDQG